MLFVSHQNIIAPIFVLIMFIFVQHIFSSIVLHVAMLVANIMNMITLMTSIMGSMQKLNASSAYFAGPAYASNWQINLPIVPLRSCRL